MSTKIEYADETLNPFAGCSPCSPGCENCYAAKAASGRFLKDKPLYKGLAKGGKWTGEVRTCFDIGRPDILEKPLHWKKPRRIFWGNMGDMFHPKVPFGFIDKMFSVMLTVDWHKHLILTKRPERMLEFRQRANDWGNEYDLLQVYHGVTICNQAEADEKIPILSQIPAANRWLSIEPMLGPININVNIIRDIKRQGKTYYGGGWRNPYDRVVVGCESGPNRRPCQIDWMIDVVKQCKAAGVSVFVKQVPVNGRVSHDMSEWPEELRVREG